MDFDPSMDLIWWDKNPTIRMVNIRYEDHKKNHHNMVKEENIPSVDNESNRFIHALQTFQRFTLNELTKVMEQVNNTFCLITQSSS